MLTERLDSLHYKIELQDGKIWKRHVNQMRAVGATVVDSTPMRALDYSIPSANANSDAETRDEIREQATALEEKERPWNVLPGSESSESKESQETFSDSEEGEAPGQTVHTALSSQGPNRKRSERKRKPPDRFGDALSY